MTFELEALVGHFVSHASLSLPLIFLKVPSSSRSLFE